MSEKYKLNDCLDFEIVGKQTIEQENYFVLKDIFETKHLLPEKYYKNYNLNIGNIIKGRIDKINCQGKIFIEPEHFFYKINQNYKFQFLGREVKVTKNGTKQTFLTVKDKFDRVCTVAHISDDQLSDTFCPKYLHCKIERIKKSRLYLSLV